MDDQLKEVIRKNQGISKIYVFLKYLITPFDEIDKSIDKKGKIIDVGCGNGMYSIYLKLKSPSRQVMGLDFDLKRINYASKISGHLINFDYIDLNNDYNLPMADCYLLNDVLHHVPYKSKKKIIQKIHNNSGKIVIKDMQTKRNLKFFLNLLVDKIMTVNQKLYFIPEDKLKKILEEYGFEVKTRRIRGFLFPHIIYLCEPKK